MKKEETYAQYAERKAKRSPLFKDMSFAFLFGGGICVIGHAVKNLFTALELDEKSSSMLTCVVLIFSAVLLTGFGVFDKIARIAGAGTLVPITGFANAMASPAIDAKSEGFILGVGAKIFTVAGPVILYGTAASMLYGVIYFVVKLISEGV